MPQRSRYYADVPLPPIPADEFILNRLCSYGNATAIIEHNGRQVTYDQFVSLIYSVANGLYAHGLRKDDKIAVIMGNCIEFPVIAIAAMTIGAAIAPVNPAYTAREMSEHIARCDAKMIITEERLTDTVKDAIITANIMIPIMFTGNSSIKNDSSHFASLLTFPADQLTFSRPNIDVSEDVALLLSSSGTTGPPKCAMLTHRNVVATLSLYDSQYVARPFRTDPTCLVMPFYHVFGMFSSLVALVNGGTIITVRQFNPVHLLDILQDYKIPQLAAVPPMIVFLTRDPMVLKYDLSNLKFVGVGAAPLGEELSKRFLNRFPHVEVLIQGYGLTECSKCSHMAPPLPMDRMPLASIGMLAANYDCMIVDVVNGKELGPNNQGELWIRGPSVFKGYYNNEKATLESKDQNGWLHTGDIGYVDDDGFYFITDRLKELIKVRGFQVAPAELEDILFEHPAVADCAVIGVPDEAAGELPRAFIVKNAGLEAVPTQEIVDFVKKKVAHFKQLKGGIEFVTSIPKSPSGKILRREIRKQYKSKTQVIQSKL